MYRGVGRHSSVETIMTTDSIRSLESRTIEGTDVLVGTEPGEVFLDLPATEQNYVRVVEGELVQEGDVRTRDDEELASRTLRRWRIDEITAENVRGTDLETGEPAEWTRDSLERKLANGTLSTDLTGFERADLPRRSDDEADGDASEVTVTVYGNNGRRFQQTFRPTNGDGESGTRLEVTESDPTVERFDDDLRERFLRTVEVALQSEGYAV